MYLCTSESNRDTISYFPIYMKHCTVSQVNNDEGYLYSAPAVLLLLLLKLLLLLTLVDNPHIASFNYNLLYRENTASSLCFSFPMHLRASYEYFVLVLVLYEI